MQVGWHSIGRLRRRRDRRVIIGGSDDLYKNPFNCPDERIFMQLGGPSSNSDGPAQCFDG